MLKFLVFADLHYKKRMYAPQVRHLQAILDRAAAENVDFVIHAGDFCNDYAGSPELMEAYLHNSHGLPVYGVYGNHELETRGNTMAVVTPLLCNRAVVFGGEDVGYWYTDMGDYRIIGLDTNYSYSDTARAWEHNAPASWGAPAGNRLENSLGPRQLEWLEGVLREAAGQKKQVLVVSHAGMSGIWESSPDAQAVRELFSKYPNTVLMSLNGHLHTDHFAVLENVAYFDVNVVLNGYWKVMQAHHYLDSHTFRFQDFDNAGTESGVIDMKLNALAQAKNTWYFETPLSAVVTITDSGTVTVDGSKTEWLYGVEPQDVEEGVKTEIACRKAALRI